MPFINPAHNSDVMPDGIIELWQKLALSTGQADPVCCAPAWNIAYHTVFFPHNRIFYLQALESLLLFRETRSSDNYPVLVPLEDSWLFGQPLLGFYAPELLEEALDLFDRAYRGLMPPILLSGIRMQSPETIKLYSAFSRTFNFFRYAETRQCSASLAGGLDGWFSRRSGNHRAKLRKAARRARENGIVFERFCPKSVPEALAIYERMLKIERQSWKGLGHCGMAEHPSCDFYAALIKRYAEADMAHVIFAVQDGRDLGFVFGGATGAVYRGQQFSYVEDASRMSIGNLLQLEQIKWLCELGFMRYDMGPISGPRMEYKRHWTEESHTVQTWLMRRKSATF